MSSLRSTLEFLGGSRDDAPEWLAERLGLVARCCVWMAAIALIYAFCGQASKFIYIDF
jgi:hypothetical protein